jgi:lincosamide nucleotidyltransferase A/C/D/E
VVRTWLRQRWLTRTKFGLLALGELAFNLVAVGPLDGLRRLPLLNRMRVRWHNTMNTECTLRDVEEVLGALDGAGVQSWLGGGWAVDALVGHQTRPHTDVDLLVRREDLDRIRGALEEMGFRVGDIQPGTGGFILEHQSARDPAGRLIDLHIVDMRTWPPVRLKGNPFTRGTLNGRPVDCLSIEAIRTGCRAGITHNDQKPEYYLNLRRLDEVESRTS